MLAHRIALAVGLGTLFVAAALQTPSEPRVVVGAGAHRYEWLSDWAKLPDGMRFGNTHGCVAVDGRGRVYVDTDTENAVIVFESDGRFVKSWGKELAGGLHGMTLAKEGDAEFFYLAHTARHQVSKTTLDGDVLWTIPWPEASGKYASESEYAPTSVVPLPDGSLAVADGYGKSWIHFFDRERKYVRSIGGPGSEIGKLATPHGMWLDTRGAKLRLVVADRENHRLQAFDLEGRPLGAVAADLRRPCNVQGRGGEIVVADLAGRISLFDARDELIAHLGDNPDESKRAQNGVPREAWRDGEFLSPHAACFDAEGNLYVVDWSRFGRVTMLRRIP
jgi:DNA-binding beta-propeller fold protein YncE